MSDYIKKVTDNIPDKKLKKEISEELSCHIEEKAEFYIKRGYPREDAYKKADEDMGNEAVKVALSLSEIHPVTRKKTVFCSIITCLIAALILFSDSLIFFFLFFPLGTEGVFLSGIIYILIFLLMKNSIKLKSVVMAVALCILSATRIYYIFQLPFFYGMIEILSGSGMGFYSDLVSRDIAPSENLMYITAFFIAVVFIISVLIIILSFKYKTNSFSKKMLSLKKILDVSVSSLLIFTVFSVGFTVPVYFYEPDYKYDYVSDVAIVYIEDEEEAEEMLMNHEKNPDFIAKTKEKSYYIGHGVDFSDEYLDFFGYIDGEQISAYYEEAYIRSSSASLYEPVNYAYYRMDEFTQERRMSIPLSVEAKEGYLLIIPKIDEDDNKRYLISESEIISLPLEKEYFITGNWYSSYYEIILRNSKGEIINESK